MYRLFGLVGMLVVAVLVSGTSAIAEDKDKVPEISEIMKKAHGKGGLRAKVTGAVKKGDFETAAKEMEAWQKLASALGKNKCPKGDEKSWKKMTATYDKQIKTLAGFVKEKNAKGAATCLGVIGKSCGGCHKAHK